MPVKKNSKAITKRFLEEMDRIVGRSSGVKVTAQQFGEALGMNPGNFPRLRSKGPNYVTVEDCYKLCKTYGTDPAWLLMGTIAKGKDPLSDLEKRVAAIEKSLNLKHSLKQKVIK